MTQVHLRSSFEFFVLSGGPLSDSTAYKSVPYSIIVASVRCNCFSLPSGSAFFLRCSLDLLLSRTQTGPFTTMDTRTVFNGTTTVFPSTASGLLYGVVNSILGEYQFPKFGRTFCKKSKLLALTPSRSTCQSRLNISRWLDR